VVFIDAAAEGTPGEVCCFALNSLSPTLSQGARAMDSLSPWERAGERGLYHAGSHESTPDGLLALARDLFGRCPPAHMVTIVGEAFEIGEALSPAVEAVIPAAVQLLLEETTDFTDYTGEKQQSV
jgi:Ni,Fe-hydrogenase maturation factor